MKTIRILLLTATAFTISGSGLAWADPKTGIAMHGDPALPVDFRSLPYANPDAPQGGALRQAVTGTFDSVNPFILKGTSAANVRTFVFESLMARNWAEPFSLYGLLADSIDVSDDRQTFTYKIRPEAKFSDGNPVTAADVVFSMKTLMEKGKPNYKNSYSKVTKTETPDDHTLIFYQEAGDRELPLIVGLMPILEQKFWDGKTFEDATLEPIIGSGPYMIGDIRPGEKITYKKNPNYWGKNLPISKGLWNFDTVQFDYYKDANAALEAFKKGEADFRMENDPKKWTTAYDFPAVADGKVVKEFVDQKTPAAATGFAFNTRRPIFADAKVREALIMAFDFEWANANLFSGKYHRTFGYFGGSELSSRDRPADAAELAILGDDAKRVSADGSYKLPVSDGSGKDRKILRSVVAKLGEAGWTIADGKMVNAKGEPFAFTITVQNPDQEKIALLYQRSLETVGIKADVRTVDASQFSALQKVYDYDMIPYAIYNSLSPGNEQKLYFGSDGKTKEGTRNYPGIADPAIDRAIDSLLKAKTRTDLVAAARAEDRLLVAGNYIVPFYDLGGTWVARWNYIGRPDQQPLPGFEATTLWRIP